MHKHTPKSDLKVTGTMNETDAGKAGNTIATADLIAAPGKIFIAIAALIYAVRWW